MSKKKPEAVLVTRIFMGGEFAELFDQALSEIIDASFLEPYFSKRPFAIPPIAAEDVDAPVISVERQPKRSDVKKTISLLEGELPKKPSTLSIADVKYYYVKKDLGLLVDLVDRYFDHELKKIGVDIDNPSSDIIQTVEVDFAMIDFCPGDTKIHYRLFTKRGIGQAKETNG